jgi:hypothetical protein
MVDAPCEHLSFARKLKQSAAALWGIDPALWEDLKNEDGAIVALVRGVEMDANGDFSCDDIVATFTAREHLQRYGTESHRDVFGQHFWVDAALDRSFPEGTFHFFTDVRFPNEAQEIRAKGGLIIHVLGPDEDTGVHVSEVPLPDGMVDYVLENHIRDDGFRHLDAQLRHLADILELPLLPLATWV